MNVSRYHGGFKQIQAGNQLFDFLQEFRHCGLRKLELIGLGFLAAVAQYRGSWSHTALDLFVWFFAVAFGGSGPFVPLHTKLFRHKTKVSLSCERFTNLSTSSPFSGSCSIGWGRVSRWYSSHRKCTMRRKWKMNPAPATCLRSLKTIRNDEVDVCGLIRIK